MKRILAQLGLLAVLAGIPVALRLLVGAPAIPTFKGSDGLSGSYVPLDAVLTLIGLLSWALWAYLALSILLHSLAILTASVNAPGPRTLFAASTILTPKVVRAVVELALGGVLVTASATVHASIALPAASHHALAHAGPIRHSGTVIADTAVSEPKPQTYRVRPGDSLWRIAERKLGSGFRWREIYRLNEGRRFFDGGSLTDPHLIRPGWVLELPEHQTTQPQDDVGKDESSPSPTPVTSTSPSPTASSSPLPSSESTAEPTQEAADDEAETDDRKTPATTAPAVQIPSGLLVAASFASGLLTAHLLGKLHRRRSRRISGTSSVEPVDVPDLIQDLRRAGASEMAGPLDVAIDSVTEIWLAHAGSWPHVLGAIEGARHVSVLLRAGEGPLPADSGGAISPHIRFVRAGTHVIAQVDGPFPVQLRKPQTALERGLLVPLGRAADGSAVHASATGLGGFSITGMEAVALMWQLVLCAATQDGPDDLRVVLLGSSDVMRPLSRLPQADVRRGWEGSPQVLRELELEFVRRARLFLQEGAQDVADHLAEHSDERLPAILVVCEEPPPELVGQIEALAGQAASLGAAVLALGWRWSGAQLHARAGRPVELETELPLPRSLEPFTLDDEAADEAIDILRQAYPLDARVERRLEEADEGSDGGSSPTAPIQMPVSDAEPRLVHDSERPLPPSAGPPAPPENVVGIRCLGPFEISRGGEPIATGWSLKGRELVAYLVAHPAGVPRERVMDELWPEIDPALGKQRFKKAATLARSAARGTQDSRTYIERVGESAYRLEDGAWWIDAWEFERLIGDAERQEDEVDAIVELRATVALYRGEFCDDVYYSWLEPVRERFRSLFIEACARLAYLLSDAGEQDEALSVLDRAIQVDPVCEDLVRRAITVEAKLGRRSAALARYRRLEARLDAELDVEPDPETQGLVEQLLAQSKRAG